MKVITTIAELEKQKELINSVLKTNYQQTYENIYSIHLSNSTAITFIEEKIITTFVKKNDNIYECALNVEPFVCNYNNDSKKNILNMINKIYLKLRKVLYFPLVYEDSLFYKMFKLQIYNYERLYTSISNYTQIKGNILDNIYDNNRLYYNIRNVKKFEKELTIKYLSKIDVKDIIKDIEINSWKYEKKQDMLSKSSQLIYYNELVKLGVASIAVAYSKKNNEPVAYRIDAIFNKKVHVLKNSYKQQYKKFSPGTYMLIYDLYNKYKEYEYVDLYGGPGLAKKNIETSKIKRYDMCFGDKFIIKEIEENRKKWDEKNYNNYLLGDSVQKVFKSKENVLAVTSCFGLGPVGKLNSIVELSKYKYNWFAAGEEFDINIFSSNIFKDVCFTLNIKKIQDFVDKYDIKYAVVILKNKMAHILKKLGVKVVYVDSLPFMWSIKDAEEGKVPYEVDCYCAQKTLELSNASKKIFSKVQNLIWVDPIINVKTNNAGNKKLKYSSYILINIGGLHSSTINNLDYIDVVVKPLIELLKDKKIIITTSTSSNKILEKYLKQFINVKVLTLGQTTFFDYIKQADAFFTSPGLTTILESSTLVENVIFLPPQNISQFYNITYGKKIFKKYKEITWNNPDLTLNGLKDYINNDEKKVIEEINNKIKLMNRNDQLIIFKSYMKNILDNVYKENIINNKIKFNGAIEVINILDNLIGDKK